MSMYAMTDLRKMLCKELDEIARKDELSAGDLETVHKLTDTIKNIDKICIMDESCEYSQTGDWEVEGHGTYGRGSSYARNRDARGRYSKTSRMNRYSRDTARESMMNKLEDMLQDAHGEKEREAINRCMEQLEQI